MSHLLHLPKDDVPLAHDGLLTQLTVEQDVTQDLHGLADILLHHLNTTQGTAHTTHSKA